MTTHLSARALENTAELTSDGRANALTLACHQLRYQHTAFIRSQLSGDYKPATANKMLGALRGVLKECFGPVHMTAEDYQRAGDLPPVKVSSLSRPLSTHPVYGSPRVGLRAFRAPASP